ncbi:MAG: zinc ABC transporter substrate-binding protein [Hyphomicrobiales bacterium]|nr:zinc ABC transporter substrate-binding protein [Hyphomicrobiales bacterium]
MTMTRDRFTLDYNVISSRRRVLRHALVLAALLPLGTAGAQEAGKPLPVVASFSILGDLVKQVGGARVAVTNLVGPDQDAHVYQAKPADAKSVREARLVVINGLGFESFMPRLIKSSGTKAHIVTASTGIRTLEKAEKPAHDHGHGHRHGHGHGHDHGKIDPHAWQSIEAVKVYVANIRDGLAKADPAGAEIYARNAHDYLAQLDTLKTEIAALFADVPREKRVIITTHDAFGYFARDMDVTFVAVQGLSTEGEASAKDVARVIKLAKERKAAAIFIETMTSPRLAEQIARESGARVGGALYSDALSDEKGPAATYIALMRHNAKAIRAALGE